jgi:acyl phosphate:glycerol-3-phosphate acyltransferase
VGRALPDPNEIGIALAIAVGYLSGSIPSGYWIVAAFKHTDIRKHGSGSIGTSNVWRTYGRWYGVPVVVLDAMKGFVPALVFAHTVSPLAGVLAGAAAMLGHARPLFLKFEKGGKMVATCGGAFLGVAWLVGLIGVAVWIVVFILTRYASVASLIAALALPTAAVLLGEPWPVFAFAAVSGAAVIVLHRANVKRLLRGEENRFSWPRGNRTARA